MKARKPLTVSVAQPLSVSGELAANVAAHVEVVLASRARLVVFPELSLTAYDHAVTPISLDALELLPLTEAAATCNSVLLVGAPVKINQQRFIAFIRIDPLGISIAYCKTCLTPDEQRIFKKGAGPNVIDVDGWKIGLAICMDAWNVNYLKSYGQFDLDLIVAGVVDQPEEEISAYEIRALMARRLQVPVAVARTAGSGPIFRCSSGRSVIYNHTGEILAQAGTATGEFASATLYPRA